MSWKLKRVGRPPTPTKADRRQARRLQTDVPTLLASAHEAMYRGEFDVAEQFLRVSQRKAPTDPHVYEQFAYFAMLRDGFAGMTWWDFSEALRLKWDDLFPGVPLPPTNRWRGQPIPGRSLLICTRAQGIGDVVQLVRMVPALKQQSQATVVLEVPEGLTRVLQGVSGPDGLIEIGQPIGDVDAYVLAHPITPEIPHASGYLTAEPDLVAHWKPTFTDRQVLHVGLQWRAAATHPTGTDRTIFLSALAPLFDVPNTRFYGLQLGAANEMRAFPAVRDLSTIDDPRERLVHTAAVLTHLDVVICCDSALGHVAGALGVPCWVLLPFYHDVRWGTVGHEWTWYAHHRLFRQHRRWSWREVVAAVQEELAGLAAKTTAGKLT
jgi:Glycosyltransferase family 9 (heptosyltransferase)